MANTEKPWWRDVAVGVLVAVLSTFAILQLGLDRRSGASAAPTVPGASPVSESAKLVGTWYADVQEDGIPARIVWELGANGTSHYLFTSGGSTGEDFGSWQYTDGVVFERFSNGSSGRGAIRWINDREIELTILDNGIPNSAGRKRYYHRQ